MVYFAVHKPFSLMGPTCLFLLLFVLCFHIEEIARKTKNKFFFSPVPSKNLKVSDPFWVNFHDWHNIGVQFHPFAYGYSIFPTTFIEDYPFPHWECISSLSNINWPNVWGFSPVLSFLFHWSMCLHIRKYHIVLITLALQFSLKSESVMSLAVFFLRITLLISSIFMATCKF